MLMEAETVCNHARWPALSGESAKPRGRLSCVGCGVQPPIHSQQTFGFQAMPRSPLDANSGLLPKVDAYYLDWVWETATTQLGMVAAIACIAVEARALGRTLLLPKTICGGRPSACHKPDKMFDLSLLKVVNITTNASCVANVQPTSIAVANTHCQPATLTKLYPRGGRAVLLRLKMFGPGVARWPSCTFSGMHGSQLATGLLASVGNDARFQTGLASRACRALNPAGCDSEQDLHAYVLASLLLVARRQGHVWPSAPPAATSNPYTAALAHSFRTQRAHFRRHAASQPEIPVLPTVIRSRHRVAIKELILPSARCVRMPPKDKRCPRSFGNSQQITLGAMLFATVLRARLVRSDTTTASAGNCNKMLRFQLTEWLDRAPPDRESNAFTVKLRNCSAVADALSSAPPGGRCYSTMLTWHAQQMGVCLNTQLGYAAATLFRLGPHVAYGALFEAAFAFPNETVPEMYDDELRISVHVRHFDAMHSGAENVGVFEGAIRNATNHAKRCALFVASDRRLTVTLFEGVAARLGCRLVNSARGASTGRFTVGEHGVDTGIVVLRDVFLLSHGHVLIGTWGSSLTVLIQELLAARSWGPQFPTVTYYDLGAGACLRRAFIS